MKKRIWRLSITAPLCDLAADGGSHITSMDEEPTREELEELQNLQAQFADDYYAAIGKGISAWSQTEGALVVIAGMLLDTTFQKAGLILYSIQNIHSWLSIIDELFAMDPRYQPLRSDWTAIGERLKKLNDTRVRLAHHALDHGKSVEALKEGETFDVLFPSIKPNRFDTRNKSKKHSPLRIEELAAFITDLATLNSRMNKLMVQMGDIYVEPTKKLAQKVRAIRKIAANPLPLDAHGG